MAALAQKIECHTHPVNSVAFSSDGKQVASGSIAGTICIWDVATGNRVQKLEGWFSQAVNSVTFSPDGKQIVFGLNNQAIYVWDVATADCTQTLAAYAYLISLAITGQKFEAFSQISSSDHSLYPRSSHPTFLGKYTFAHDLCWINFPYIDVFTYDETSHFLELFSSHSHFNKFWVLPQYQDIVTIAQHGSTVCFGCESGAVVILQF